MTDSQQHKTAQIKDSIIKEAKKDFYEKGYYRASLTEICRSANISGGKFSYYFKNKRDLASTIYGQLLSECLGFIEERSEWRIDSVRRNVYSVFLFLLIILRDVKTAAFHYEVLINESGDEFIRMYFGEAYHDFSAELNLGFTHDEVEIAASADSGMRRELTLCVLKEVGFKLSEGDIIKLAENINICMARLFKIDESLMLGIIEEAKEFLRENDYSSLRLLI